MLSCVRSRRRALQPRLIWEQTGLVPGTIENTVVGACAMTGTGERELLGDIGRAYKILSALECTKHLNRTDFK